MLGCSITKWDACTGLARELHTEFHLDLIGAPGEIRTPDPQIRSLVLYPAELRARKAVLHFLTLGHAVHR
jgi:hypothetical protein